LNTSSNFAAVTFETECRSYAVHCATSELVVLVFEQDVERGEGSVTASHLLLQVELVRFAQFAWHAVASAKAGRLRSLSARELADYFES
jgi:hypothetical protein